MRDELNHIGDSWYDLSDDSYRIKEYDTAWGKLYRIQVCLKGWDTGNLRAYFEISDIHLTIESAVTAARAKAFTCSMGNTEESSYVLHARLE